MRKFTSIMLITTLLTTTMLTGCGRDYSSPITKKTYTTYGLLNKEDNKNPNIRYDICWGNVIWGAILIETIIAPIYFFGFSLYNPIGDKGPMAEEKGVVR